jgi:hypothetical protein
MSNNVEPIDDFELDAPSQAEAKEQQAVAKVFIPLKVEHEHDSAAR